MADRKTGTFDTLEHEDVDESSWDSPVKPTPKSKDQSSKTAQSARPKYEDQEVGDQALRQELANVRKVNETIEGVIQGLDKAKKNMGTVNQTVDAASSLLNMWTRILSQTEHNQRLILDPTWQGTSHDIADMETEAAARQQAVLRRDAEEQERKNAAMRKAEDDERRRTAATAQHQKSSLKGRGRVTSRGVSASQSGFVGDTSTSSSSTARGSTSARRTASSIGRGRGRGRG